MISLPSSSSKRYLSGMDWLIQSLDSAARAGTGIGNVSQIVLELQGEFPYQVFLDHMREFVALHPFLTGFTSRDWNLAPYWKIPASAGLRFVPVQKIVLNDEENEEEINERLTESVNRCFDHKRHHLSFSVLSGSNRAFLVMQFDHCLLDARGAEAFLGQIHAFICGKIKEPYRLSPAPAYLDHWAEKFESGRQVSRMFVALGEKEPPSSIPLPYEKKDRASAFVFRSYSADRGEEILQDAYKRAGYLMISPYLLAHSARAAHLLFSKYGYSRDHYIIPVNVDMRLKEDIDEKLFFNHLSFTYYKYMAEECESIDSLCSMLTRQLYEQVKKQVSYHLVQASIPLRIAPKRLLARLIRIPFKGTMGSFSFSYLGHNGYSEDNFMGLKIRNILHMPRVPHSPGMGIFVTRFQGQFNIVISYMRGSFLRQDVEEMLDEMEKSLPG